MRYSPLNQQQAELLKATLDFLQEKAQKQYEVLEYGIMQTIHNRMLSTYHINTQVVNCRQGTASNIDRYLGKCKVNRNHMARMCEGDEDPRALAMLPSLLQIAHAMQLVAQCKDMDVLSAPNAPGAVGQLAEKFLAEAEPMAKVYLANRAAGKSEAPESGAGRGGR